LTHATSSTNGPGVFSASRKPIDVTLRGSTGPAPWRTRPKEVASNRSSAMATSIHSPARVFRGARYEKALIRSDV
jgi:hypothetical protein